MKIRSAQLLKELKTKLDKDLSRQSTLKEEYDNKFTLYEANKLTLERNSFESELLHQACEKARENGRKLMENLCTQGVQMILNEPLAVKVEHDVKNGLPYDNLVLQSNYDNDEAIYTNPAEEEGGGLADIVSLSCFISLRTLMGESNKAPLFLDEPSKYVSRGNAQNVSDFIRKMYDLNKIQTFVITHENDYIPAIADKHFHLQLDDKGVTTTLKSIVDIDCEVLSQ